MLLLLFQLGHEHPERREGGGHAAALAGQPLGRHRQPRDAVQALVAGVLARLDAGRRAAGGGGGGLGRRPPPPPPRPPPGLPAPESLHGQLGAVRRLSLRHGPRPRVRQQRAAAGGGEI